MTAIATRAAAAAVVALAAGCGSKGPAAPAPATAPSTPAPGPTASAEARVCGDRRPCRVVEELAAGKAADGAPLRVLHLGFGPASAAPAEAEDEEGDDGADESECEPFEYWLVVGEPVRSVQKLLDICNDGYGASGVGEDSVEVEANRFRHGRYGGSAWRWSRTVTVQLSPLRILDDAHSDDYMGSDSNASSSTWSWVDFAGRGEATAPPCGPDGAPLDTSEHPDAALAEARWLAIPQVALPAAFAKGDWRTTQLASCAAHVDAGAGEGDAPRGFIVHGASGDPSDARMAVVAGADGALYVEIQDDRIVSGNRRWIFEDHLELWASDDAGTVDCVDPKAPTRAVQWGVRISDGKVFPAAGAPRAPLAVERASAQAGAPVRLRIALPPGSDRVTVVYSDSDDGTSQERLIATSQIVFGKSWSLGRLLAIPAGAATCIVERGALVARDARRFEPGQAVIGED